MALSARGVRGCEQDCWSIEQENPDAFLYLKQAYNEEHVSYYKVPLKTGRKTLVTADKDKIEHEYRFNFPGSIEITEEDFESHWCTSKPYNKFKVSMKYFELLIVFESLRTNKNHSLEYKLVNCIKGNFVNDALVHTVFDNYLLTLNNEFSALKVNLFEINSDTLVALGFYFNSFYILDGDLGVYVSSYNDCYSCWFKINAIKINDNCFVIIKRPSSSSYGSEFHELFYDKVDWQDFDYSSFESIRKKPKMGFGSYVYDYLLVCNRTLTKEDYLLAGAKLALIKENGAIAFQSSSNNKIELEVVN